MRIHSVSCVNQPQTESFLDRSKVSCENRVQETRIYQKLGYWVVENFIKANHGDLDCTETVTFTTTAEYPDLYNLVPLVQRWQSPISLALYCPRDDYQNCIDSLVFLRKCIKLESQRHFMRKYLSVHIFFEDSQIPENVFSTIDDVDIRCGENPMYRPKDGSSSLDSNRENVGRNVAKDAALTHYILSSDIELTPSSDLASDFLRTIAMSGSAQLSQGTVYLLPVFDATQDSDLPQTKTDLLNMLSNGSVVQPELATCRDCQRYPVIQEWAALADDSGKVPKSVINGITSQLYQF